MALLTWRFFTFYLFLIVGVGMVILERILVNREKKRRLLAEMPENPEGKQECLPEGNEEKTE